MLPSRGLGRPLPDSRRHRVPILCVSMTHQEVYRGRMVRRTNLNLDMDLVAQAARELGTIRTTDTVHEALRDVIARARRTRLAARDFADLTPEALDEMRRATGRTA